MKSNNFAAGTLQAYISGSRNGVPAYFNHSPRLKKQEGHYVPQPQLGLCESRFFLQFMYSIELFIEEYLSTPLVPEVAIKYRMAQNKRTLTSGFSFNFVTKQQLEMRGCYSNASEIFTK